jgi:hypothetical protein
MNRGQISARLKKTYGITLGEYETMLSNQGGVCAICKRPPKKNMLSVDHDHKFNKLAGKLKGQARVDCLRKSIRGIICMRDNRGLQFFSDDPTRLRAAADYLEKFQKNLK